MNRAWFRRGGGRGALPAGRTQKSTAEIQTMLTGLQRGTQTVVTAMGNTRQSRQDAAENTSKVNASLGSDGGEVGGNQRSISHIAGGGAADAVAEEINRNMSAIAEVITQPGRAMGSGPRAARPPCSAPMTGLREIVGTSWLE